MGSNRLELKTILGSGVLNQPLTDDAARVLAPKLIISVYELSDDPSSIVALNLTTRNLYHVWKSQAAVSYYATKTLSILSKLKDPLYRRTRMMTTKQS